MEATKTHKVPEESKVIGKHTLSNFDMRFAEALMIEREIEANTAQRQEIIRRPMDLFGGTAKYLQDLQDNWYHYQELVAKLQRYKTAEKTVHNLITTCGRTREAERLCGDTTYTGIINYGALGTGSTAPANTDTQLTTEVFRKIVASADNVANIAYIDFYFTKADCNGTYEEYGTFIDGAAGANTGMIYTHALTSSWVKPATESMIAASQYTKS